MCTHTRQVHRTPSLQQNWQSSENSQNFKKKNTILNEHPVHLELKIHNKYFRSFELKKLNLPKFHFFFFSRILSLVIHYFKLRSISIADLFPYSFISSCTSALLWSPLRAVTLAGLHQRWEFTKKSKNKRKNTVSTKKVTKKNKKKIHFRLRK